MSKHTDREKLAEKAKNKRLDYATQKWQKAQLAAAQAAETLDKALATVVFHKDELTEQQLADVYEQMRVNKKELEDFLREEQRKYAAELDAISLEAVVYEADKKLVNLEDL